MRKQGNFFSRSGCALGLAWTYEADYRHRMRVGLRRIVALI